MVCCMVQSICACIASTCSRVIEGGGWRVGVLVVVLPVVFSIVGGDMVLCVGHLKHEY
jgi:hypothetical protein